MLAYELLKRHAGILLIGDYTTLRALRDVIHDVNSRSPLIKDPDGDEGLTHIAFELRKAYEGAREILQPPKHYDEMGIRYGTRFTWPTLLYQQRLLRASLAFLDHNRQHQAMTYALEAVLESALRDDFGSGGQVVVDSWQSLDPASCKDPGRKVTSRNAIYCSWDKTQRKRGLRTLLESFDAMYQINYDLGVKHGESGLIAPTELDAWADVECPDPRW